jgi:isocitrate dehydrogenase (NADP) (EC 1.1.1.42)
VTYDLHRQIDGGQKLSTSAFADAVCEQMDSYT